MPFYYPPIHSDSVWVWVRVPDCLLTQPRPRRVDLPEYGGTRAVESHEGEGTKFIMLLL